MHNHFHLSGSLSSRIYCVKCIVWTENLSNFRFEFLWAYHSWIHAISNISFTNFTFRTKKCIWVIIYTHFQHSDWHTFDLLAVFSRSGWLFGYNVLFKRDVNNWKFCITVQFLSPFQSDTLIIFMWKGMKWIYMSSLKNANRIDSKFKSPCSHIINCQ